MDIPYLVTGEYDPEYQELLNRILLDGLKDGVYNQEFTTAQITALTSSDARPVLRRGTQFFNTDLGKMQIIVQAAVPNTTNAVLETITST